MRDNFEQEMLDMMSTFDREPPRGVWDRIKLHIQSGGILNNSTQLLIVGVSLALGALLTAGVYLITDEETKPKLEEEVQEEENDDEVIAAGERLYKNQCATCHTMDMKTDATGPALGGVTQKRSKEWLYAFTRSSQEMVNNNDSIALLLWSLWGPTVMNNFKHFTDGQLDTLYAYIEFVSNTISPDSLLMKGEKRNRPVKKLSRRRERIQLEIPEEYKDKNEFHKGEYLYQIACADCHGEVDDQLKTLPFKVQNNYYNQDWFVEYVKDTKQLLKKEDVDLEDLLESKPDFQLHKVKGDEVDNIRSIYTYLKKAG